MDSEVELEKVTKTFGTVVAIKDVSFTVERNEFFSLLGPSGCGKSTTLRIIAGLESPDKGIVRLRGDIVNDVPPHKRNIGMVFQHLALFPHMDVYRNIAFGLEMKKVSKDEINRRVRHMLEIVGMKGLERRRIQQLSGGQQQRVAIARALVTEPTVLLLDEPLGALDLKIRQHMMLELKRIQREVGATFIYVTHDQGEAFTMSDRIAVLREGVIEQIGTPTEIYESPLTKFVADFIGETNFIEGTYTGEGSFETDLSHTPLKVNAGPEYAGKKMALFIRPEKIRVEHDLRGLDNILEGTVEERLFRGQDIRLVVNIAGRYSLRAIVPTAYLDMSVDVGDKVKLGWKMEDGILLS